VSSVALLQLNHPIDSVGVVHLFSVPLGDGRFRGDIQPFPVVVGGEGKDVSAETCVGAGGDGLAVRVLEFRQAGVVHGDGVARFVDVAVVMAA